MDIFWISFEFVGKSGYKLQLHGKMLKLLHGNQISNFRQNYRGPSNRECGAICQSETKVGEKLSDMSAILRNLIFNPKDFIFDPKDLWSNTLSGSNWEKDPRNLLNFWQLYSKATPILLPRNRKYEISQRSIGQFF